MQPCQSSPPTRSRHDLGSGFTVTEMLVAMMLLTIGSLALYQSMSASNDLAASGDRLASATQLTASELEKARAIPYDQLAMKVPATGSPTFEGAPQVTDASNGRIISSSSAVIDGVTYEIARYVTWRSATVNGTTVDKAFKQVTVIVRWNDDHGSHDTRSDTAISRTAAP